MFNVFKCALLKTLPSLCRGRGESCLFPFIVKERAAASAAGYMLNGKCGPDKRTCHHFFWVNVNWKTGSGTDGFYLNVLFDQAINSVKLKTKMSFGMPVLLYLFCFAEFFSHSMDPLFGPPPSMMIIIFSSGIASMQFK